MCKIVTALATPFVEDKVDVNSLARLVKYQVAMGADALLCCGATGEGVLLSHCERKLIATVVKSVANIPVWLGIDGRSTAEAVGQAQQANALGVDKILIAPPAFCKCTTTGFLQHLQAIKEATDIPMVLYNAPSRVGYVLPLEVISEVARWGVEVKDAGVDVYYTKKLQAICPVYCGNEQILEDFVKIGVNKVVSVVANVSPQLVKEAIVGRNEEYFDRLARRTMLEVNPVGIKYMLYKMGIFDNYDLRLPLTKASVETQKAIDEVWI